MRKLILSISIASCLLGLNTPVFSQLPATAKQGPSGVFIFMGKEIPVGKNVAGYKIERTEDNVNWKLVTEIKTPSDFNAFNKAVENAKSSFPTQPIPALDKLGLLYAKAVETGNTDSMKGMRLLFPIRVALGIMYYDTSANKPNTYRYRVNAIKPSGEVINSYLSDTVSMPFRVKFDTISYSESSYNQTSVLIKWKSAGKNPAPLFMVYKFRFGAPVVAHGSTSRFSMNDTTYYLFTDTTVAKEAGKEMQFFISPFDHFGNSGLSSQVAVITQDNFNKANFVRGHIEFMPKLSGVQVCWHFTDPITVKTFEIYRSEKPDAGYSKLGEISSNDTSYLDQRIWPEKSYYYFVQAVAKAGKRTQQTEVMMAAVPGMVTGEKPQTPVLKQVAVVNNYIRLLIEVNDTITTHIRIYRGVKGGLIALPVLLNTNKAAFLSYTDSTLAAEDMKDVFYAVRNEKAGSGISALSEELPVAMLADPNEVAYFYAFPSKGKMELYWDDVVNRRSQYSSYVLARKYGPANSKTPLKVLAENLTNSTFSDNEVQSGSQYTYVLKMTDKTGKISENSWSVTTPAGENK